MREQVLRVLKFLQQEFQDLEDQVQEGGASREKPDDRFLPSQEEQNPSETQQIYMAVRDHIGSLFEISMIVQRPTRIDLMREVAAEDVCAFALSDQMHVADKLPYIEPWLQSRLFSNVTMMRQRLQY